MKGWVDRTPPNFFFSAKLPQEITHKKKLDLQLEDSFLATHFNSFLPLEESHRMIGHLIQLPPSFHMDKHWNVLENFLNLWHDWRETKGRALLGSNFTEKSFWPIIEFRHKSWMKERTFALLNAYNVTYCAVIEPFLPPRFEITTPELFYLRFHGYGKDPFWKYNFSKEELGQWAEKLLNSSEKNKNTTHVAYFNNHFSGYAVKNALDIIPNLNQHPITPLDQVNRIFLKKHGSKKGNRKNLAEAKKHVSLDSWMPQKEEKT